MNGFFDSLLNYSFLQNAVLAAVLAAVVCGIVGPFIVIKRISYVSGSIAHAVLGGVGVAYYLGFPPLAGAFISAVIFALILAWIRLKADQHEDTVIGAIWAMGMAIGVIFMYLTPGYNVDLLTFLFGNILMVSGTQIYLLSGLNLLIIIVFLLFFRQFLAISFDEEYARLRGLPVDFLYILLMVMIAITIVVLIQIVGLLLVIALLTLPAATAGLFTRTASGMIFLSILLGLFFTLGGIAISYAPGIPAGATIILFSGFTFLIAIILKKTLPKRMKRKS